MIDFLKPDLNREVVTFTYEDEAGTEHIHDFPGFITVCANCQGRGTSTLHIDGHGITMDEWNHEWSDEMKDDYLRGRYNKPCPSCNGDRVTVAIDRNKANQDILAICDAWVNDMYETQATMAAERRMGA